MAGRNKDGNGAKYMVPLSVAKLVIHLFAALLKYLAGFYNLKFGNISGLAYIYTYDYTDRQRAYREKLYPN
jgi:hypothetical protein